MIDFIINNWLSLVLTLTAIITVIIICIRDYKSAEKEGNPKKYPVVLCICAIVAILLSYIS